MPRVSQREQILDAATRVLLRVGADRLTIASTAEEAGVSKGGLFYHFPTKQELLEGLVDRLVGGFDEVMRGADDRPGAVTRRYLVCLDESAQELDRPTVALLAASLVDPALLGPLRERYRRWQYLLEHDGIDPIDATVIRMAVDGVWMADAFDLAPPDPDLRAQITARLLAMLPPEGEAQQ